MQGMAVRTEVGYCDRIRWFINLTQWALVDGLEWNVRATQVDNASIVERIAATFEQYWNEPEFECYDPGSTARVFSTPSTTKSGPRADGTV